MSLALLATEMDDDDDDDDDESKAPATADVWCGGEMKNEELSREENVEMAILAKMTMRYEDMMMFMKNVVNKVDVDKLSSKELYLLSEAYKNVIRIKSTSVRTLSSIHWMEKTNKDQTTANILEKYTTYIGCELYKICCHFMNLLASQDSYLIDHTLTPECEKIYIRNLSSPVLASGTKLQSDIIIFSDGILNLLDSQFVTPDLSKESISYIYSDYFYLSLGIHYYTSLDEFKGAKIDIAKMASQFSRQENVYLAKLAEQAKRYEEMVGLLKAIVENVTEPTKEECNLLFVAYENVIEVKWTSWNIISVQLSRQNIINGNVSTIKKFKSKIETELKDIYHDLLSILKPLVPSTSLAYLEQLSLQVFDIDTKTFEEAEGAESSGGRLYKGIIELMQLFQDIIKRF
ncbi:hypothetical protein AQUCO_00201308v1 [Aquilegia coerulea]|uniref:14-3-3 domain-containing protein n=2 Tax=Aquilegia coerulea TaxID=218851 RepID=A0A2G5F7F1_AQUCA|nr:hypothetical protein AQUCO_00201308v1 [Aquilegia coerulea]